MKIKKVIIGIVAAGIVLGGMNVFNGNPISKIIVKNKVEKYVSSNYSNLNLELTNPMYNFKFADYNVTAKSKDSEDTVFTVHTDSLGNIIQDEYEYEVANCFTTWRRLSDELQKESEIFIIDKLDYDFDYGYIRFIDGSYGDDLEKLQLDMELDIYNPPIPLEADIAIFTDYMTWDTIAETAEELKTKMDEQGLPISQYSVRILPMENKPKNKDEAVPWWNSISVSEFPAEMMNVDNLSEVMEQFEKEKEAEMDKEKFS